jgi:SnoaL-like domain
MNESQALAIAQRWIEVWNHHDLEEILSHYAEEIEFDSPMIVKLLGDRNGRVTGKVALRDYFAKGLEAYPDLHFELIQVLAGVNGLVIYYRSVRELLVAEVMRVNSAELVTHVSAYYNSL